MNKLEKTLQQIETGFAESNVKDSLMVYFHNNEKQLRDQVSKIMTNKGYACVLGECEVFGLFLEIKR